MAGLCPLHLLRTTFFSKLLRTNNKNNTNSRGMGRSSVTRRSRTRDDASLDGRFKAVTDTRVGNNQPLGET